MKRTPLILASLLIFSSATAFAEHGGERMRYYYETFASRPTEG